MSRFGKMLGAVVVGGVLLGGCMTAQSPASAPNSGNVSDTGYALLFELLGDEQNVSKLLIIKRERPELNTLIKDIARVCRDAHKKLETLGKADASINLKNNGLPVGEVKTRNEIARTRAKELLVEGGKEFEVRLLLTQNEALTYALHLAKVLQSQEHHPARTAYLYQLSVELVKLQDRLVAMLLEHYSWQKPS